MIGKESVQNGGNLDIYHSYLGDARIKQLHEFIPSQRCELPFFVHPFFEFYAWHPDIIPALQQLGMDFQVSHKSLSEHLGPYCVTDKYKKSLIEYGMKLVRFFRNTSYSVIAIAEEQNHMKSTLAAIRNQGYSGIVLYYETQLATSLPAGRGEFGRLAEFFCQSRVKNLIVGGQLGKRVKTGREVDALFDKGIYAYEVDARSDPGNYQIQRVKPGGTWCVGSFISTLERTANRYRRLNKLKKIFPERIVLSPIVWNSDS